jgi:hypothetical protein
MRSKTDNRAFQLFKENVETEIKELTKKLSGSAKQSLHTT